MSIAKTKSWDITTNQDYMRTIDSVPDPDWKYVDKKRHYHQWKKSKKKPDSWHVTNGKLVEYTYHIPEYCECCDAEIETEEVTGYYWACARCGEKLYPEYKDVDAFLAGMRETAGSFTTTEKYQRIPKGRFRLQSWLSPKDGMQPCGMGIVTSYGPSITTSDKLTYKIEFTVIGQLTMKFVA